MPLSVIKITLYDPETSEIKDEHARAFIPWKILKRAARLMKKVDPKRPNDLTDDVVDELTALIAEAFGNKVSVHDLEEYSDVGEMMAILDTIVNRAQGILPNPPPPGT